MTSNDRNETAHSAAETAGEASNVMDRRRMLGLLGLTATAAYVAPTLLSVKEARASGGSGGSGSGDAGGTSDGGTGAGGSGSGSGSAGSGSGSAASGGSSPDDDTTTTTPTSTTAAAGGRRVAGDAAQDGPMAAVGGKVNNFFSNLLD